MCAARGTGALRRNLALEDLDDETPPVAATAAAKRPSSASIPSPPRPGTAGSRAEGGAVGSGGSGALSANFSSLPLSPHRPGSGFPKGRVVRPASARPQTAGGGGGGSSSSSSRGKLVPPGADAAHAANGAAAGTTNRLCFDRPLGLPATMCSMPIGHGPMPARPISAHSFSLSRPKPRGALGREADLPAGHYQQPPPHAGPRSAGVSPPSARRGIEGSRLRQKELEREREWEKSGFVPPDVVVRPTKPRIPGGQWGKSERNVGVGGAKGSDPFLVNRHGQPEGGGQKITSFPWGASRPSQVFQDGPNGGGGTKSKGSGAAEAHGRRPRGPLAPANSYGPQLVDASAPGINDFVFERTTALGGAGAAP